MVALSKADKARAKTAKKTEKEVVKKVVVPLMKEAVANEMAVTRLLEQACSSAGEGAVLIGLRYKFKEKPSLTRKAVAELEDVERDIRDGKIAKDSDVFAVVKQSLQDSLRYTLSLPHEKYTSSVQLTLDALKEQGYSVLKSKNFWGKGDDYQGLNCIYTCESGFPFELQFHTPESLEYKDIGHAFYEKFRVEKDPEKKIGLFQQNCDAIMECPIPTSVESLPTIINRPPPSLLKMTAECAQDDAMQTQQDLLRILLGYVNADVLKGRKGIFSKAGKKGCPTYVSKLKSTDAILKDMDDYFEANPAEGDTKKQGKEVRSKEAIKSVTDILDVELGLPAETYVLAVKGLLAHVEGAGFTLNKVLNHWAEGDTYNGIVASISDSTGHTCCIEFHTLEGFALDQEAAPKLAAKCRAANSPEARTALAQELVTLWDSTVKAPDGALAIGEQVTHALTSKDGM